jgi:hypothetical protein
MPVDKQTIWNAVQVQEQNGSLEGVVGLVKGISERFGINAIEVETASEKLRWRKSFD